MAYQFGAGVEVDQVILHPDKVDADEFNDMPRLIYEDIWQECVYASSREGWFPVEWREDLKAWVPCKGPIPPIFYDPDQAQRNAEWVEARKAKIEENRRKREEESCG